MNYKFHLISVVQPGLLGGAFRSGSFKCVFYHQRPQVLNCPSKLNTGTLDSYRKVEDVQAPKTWESPVL